MNKTFRCIGLHLAFLFILSSCVKSDELALLSENSSLGTQKTLNPFFEDMEIGVKTSYTTGNVTLSTGAWTFNNALIGTSTSDKKNGSKSARIQSTGKLTMLSDKANGAGVVSIKHAAFGTDASSTWQLWYSTNSGASYTQAGSTVTSLTGNLITSSFTLNATGNIRLEIRKISGATSRINIDDVSISDYTSSVITTKKFLFDAKHAQTSGNADWVIDQDNGSPQQIPTPLQGTITSSTAESYWTGALSAWGIALAKLGHTVHTLPSSGSLTYGNLTNAQDLMNYDVLVIDEPNILFSAAEKTALIQFVQNGGGLFIGGNHSGSDRNFDGYDAPAIWNNFFSSNGTVVNPFGFSFDLLNLSGTTTNRATTTTNPVLNGSQGAVSSIQYSNGTSMTMNPTANASVTGLIWKSGVTKNNNNVFCLSASFGTGKVVALGDSSPTDDGTGAPGDVLYNGWSAYSHSKLLLNASLWLAE
jgi:hypothetical protein